MIVGEDDHLVAGLEIDAARHRIVSPRWVPRDDDLLGRDAQEIRQRFARRFLALGELRRFCCDGFVSMSFVMS